MTTLQPVACENRLCEYYAGAIGPDNEPVYFCRAYPVGIPLEILNGGDLHEALRGDEVAGFHYSGPHAVTEKHLGPKHDQSVHGNRGGLETIAHDDQQALGRLRQEAESFPAGPRRNEAQEALKPSKWDRVLVKRDSEGKLQGVASVWRDPDKPGKYDEVPDGRYIRIRNMATAGRGQGRGLFSDVVEQAVSQRAGVYLSSLEGSRSFYESLGLQRGTGATYYLTFEQAQQWAGASKEVSEKHLGGKHPQKRHGWRFGGTAQARSSMRGQSRAENQEYKKRARAALGRAKPAAEEPKPAPKPKSPLEQAKSDWDAAKAAERKLANTPFDQTAGAAARERFNEQWIAAQRAERAAGQKYMKMKAEDTRRRIADETKANEARKAKLRAQKKQLEADYQEQLKAIKAKWEEEHGTAEGWWESAERKRFSSGREHGRRIIALNDEMRSGSRESNQRVKDMVKVDDPAAPLDMRARVSGHTKAQQSKVESINKEFGHLVSDEVRQKVNSDYVGVTFEKKVRAYHTQGNIVLAPNDSVSIGLHELGHWLEYRNPDVGRAARRFLNRRTEGEDSRALNEITRSSRFDGHERARVDKFVNPYMGKVYRSGATEILSMGLEMFYKEPERLARMDPDYFDFVFAIVRGVDLS